MDITRFLPYNEYQAAVNANSPSAGNPFATIADLPGTPDLATVLGIGNTTSGNDISLTSGDAILIANGGNHGYIIKSPDNLTYIAINSNAIQINNNINGGGFQFNAGGTLSPIALTATGAINVNSSVAVEIINNNLRFQSNGNKFNVVANASLGATHTATFQDASGIVAYLSDIPAAPTTLYSGDSTIGSGRVATLTDTLTFERTTNKFVVGGTFNFTDIEVLVSSLNPIGFYENRIGGASVGDTMLINFAYNDSLGIRQNGSSNIASRVVSTSAGSVSTTLTFADILQVRQGYGVLISQGATTDSPIALLEIDNDASSVYSGALLVNSKDDTAASNMINLRNRSGQTCFFVQGDGKTTLNFTSLPTGDFQVKGATDVNLIYVDAGLDKVGIGHAPTGASSKLTVDGGDIEVLDQNDGLILKDRTSGTRYRVYIDATGVLHTEAA